MQLKINKTQAKYPTISSTTADLCSHLSLPSLVIAWKKRMDFSDFAEGC